MVAETVEKNTWNPIITVLVNIHTGKYASLGHWYNHISVKDEVELENEFELAGKLILIFIYIYQYTGNKFLAKDRSTC